MIELRDVYKIYTTRVGSTAALDGVSLTFPDKGLIFITGKSGSGKTTMLNVIGGLDGFDKGEIIIDGRSFSDLTPKDYDNYRNTFIGVVFQEYNLLPEYTVEKNIKIATELQGIEATDEQIDALLEQVEILEYKKRLPSQLSGGQMQRVAIARALIKDPHIILADEPTGALDSNTGIQVIETLKKLSETKLVIIVSHDLELAEKYADRIISLKDGQIVSDVIVDDVAVEGGVYDGEVFYVKSGAKLSSDETNLLVKAVEDKRKIEITEELTVREKKVTGKIEGENGRARRELISSKMKFKSSAWLGLKSLTVKPIRLIITILLAVIAFGLFGVIDSVASYDRNKIIYYNLADSGFNAVMSSGKYYTPEGDVISVKFSQNKIDEINSKTGYNFKGVYYLNDRSDTTNYSKAGIHNITDISGYSTATKQSYYQKAVYGLIEFDSSKIQEVTDNEGNITEYINDGGFNYKVIHGKFPRNKKADGSVNANLVNEVGISSYVADCIMQYCGQRNFGKSPLTQMSDLVGRTLTIDTGAKFTISCIIDCGEIPDRYSPLKTTDDNGQLASELRSFLHSGTYLYLFTDTGYFDYYQKQVNTVQTYRMPTGSTTLTIAGGEPAPQTNQKNEWYKIADIPKENILTFSESVTTNEKGEVVSRGNVEIKEGEALIDVTKLATFFVKEYTGITDEKVKASITQQYNQLKDPDVDFDTKRETLTSLIKFYESYSVDPLIGECGLLGKPIPYKLARVEQFMERSKKENKVDLKIVGIYFNINRDTTPSEWFLAVHENDFDNLLIYPDQGDYSRIVSPMVQASSSRQALAKMMCAEKGLVLDWFNNSVINMLENSKDEIEPFFDLFLYLDLVIAVFAVFMLTNYISTSIIQKKQTIGILRALGSGGKDIFLIFIIESLFIAVINGIFAALFGFAGCSLVNLYIKEVMSINVSFAIFEMRQAIMIFFASVITAILASLIPIINICKRKPVELIRRSY